MDEPDFSNCVTHVASIAINPQKFNNSADILEFCFGLCQNINGSWSSGPFLVTGGVNQDYNSAITVESSVGVHVGHRSMMVGDLIEIEDANGQSIGRWEVRGIGFKSLGL